MSVELISIVHAVKQTPLPRMAENRVLLLQHWTFNNIFKKDFVDPADQRSSLYIRLLYNLCILHSLRAPFK